MESLQQGCFHHIHHVCTCCSSTETSDRRALHVIFDMPLQPTNTPRSPPEAIMQGPSPVLKHDAPVLSIAVVQHEYSPPGNRLQPVPLVFVSSSQARKTVHLSTLCDVDRVSASECSIDKSKQNTRFDLKNFYYCRCL